LALNLKADDIENTLGIKKVQEDAKKRQSLAGGNKYQKTVESVPTQALSSNDYQRGRTNEIIAKKIGVGTTTYKQGKNVHDNGIPELTDMMLHNGLSAESGNLLKKEIN
jgi:hypothetical protein